MTTDTPIPSDNATPFKSAIITLIGRPNSGKSTLLNTVVGEEVSIVSPLPQTTRLNSRGIYTDDTMQLVFVDTPGVHQGKHTLNHAMLQEARRALDESVDLICYMVDLSREFGEEERFVASLVSSVKKTKTLIIFNKTDLVPDPTRCMEAFFKNFPGLSTSPFISMAATTKDARDQFITTITPFIHEGPLYFDADDMTDSSMRQIAAEFIRKHIIAHTTEEVPHAVFVEIDSYKETAERHSIIATIHVETTGQRGIVVGKGGAIIARIKKSAKMDISKLAGAPVSLTVHVKVSPHWRDSHSFLRHMGVQFKP